MDKGIQKVKRKVILIGFIGLFVASVFVTVIGIMEIAKVGIIRATLYGLIVYGFLLIFIAIVSFALLLGMHTVNKLTCKVRYDIEPTHKGKLTAAGYIFVMLVMFISYIGVPTWVLVYYIAIAPLLGTIVCTTVVVTYLFGISIGTAQRLD